MSTVPFDPTPYLGDLTDTPASASASAPAQQGGVLNTFLADTVGVVYRGATGKVDPWTKTELVDQAAAEYAGAGMDPATAQAQAQSDVDKTTSGNAGGSYSNAVDSALKSLFTGGDPSQPCGITNLGACVPTWVPWAVAGIGVLLVLYVLGPYVGLADDLAKK